MSALKKNKIVQKIQVKTSHLQKFLTLIQFKIKNYIMKDDSKKIPSAFIWKRLHSLTGLWLVAFLILHLFTNSQAALPINEDASGFIKAANDIRQLPFLIFIEITLLAIPFAIHIIWGIKALQTSDPNSFPSDDTKPALPEYPRNQAYTWQRITSWLLLILIGLHVVHMRFLEMPLSGHKGAEKYFIARIGQDPGLLTLSKRLDVHLYNAQEIEQQKRELEKQLHVKQLDMLNANESQKLLYQQETKEFKEWINALYKRPLGDNQLLAVANNFATAELLMVRETFKIPAMLVLYTILVVAACYHAFNGLWTFMITWGVTLSVQSQRYMRWFSTFLMIIISFLGLAAVWGTYWINLKQ